VVDAIFYVAEPVASGEALSEALPELGIPSIAITSSGSAQRHLGAASAARLAAAVRGARRPRRRTVPRGSFDARSVRASFDGEQENKGNSTRGKRSNGPQDLRDRPDTLGLLVAVRCRGGRASPTTSVGIAVPLIAPVHAQDASAKAVVRRRLQGHLHRGLPRSSRPAWKVVTRIHPRHFRGPPEALDCRAHLVMADE